MFETEADLVAAYRLYLAARGIQSEREVACSNGKGFSADLVSETTVWEAKLYLDRTSLYQALGQVISYQRVLKRPKVAIFGLLPDDPETAAQAQRIAQWLKEIHQGLWVLFVDCDPAFIQFCKHYQQYSKE